jgi:hypothetical protein
VGVAPVIEDLGQIDVAVPVEDRVVRALSHGDPNFLKKSSSFVVCL